MDAGTFHAGYIGDGRKPVVAEGVGHDMVSDNSHKDGTNRSGDDMQPCAPVETGCLHRKLSNVLGRPGLDMEHRQRTHDLGVD